MKKELQSIERMSLANSSVENLLSHIIAEVEKLPTEFPEIESDDYDNGNKNFKEMVIKLLNS